jgi:hypothetical protein
VTKPLLPARYRKRPVLVEAMRWTGDNFREITDWADDVWHKEGDLLVVHTLEGSMTANRGDWIVRGIKGEFYPVRNDIFEATYEAVERETFRPLTPNTGKPSL